LAYIAGDCSLTDGIDDLDDWDRTIVIHRAFAEVDAALSAKLLIGIADLENLSVPPWAVSVGAARNALIAHEQAWVVLLEDEMLLASRISNEGTLEDRQEMIQDLADLPPGRPVLVEDRPPCSYRWCRRTDTGAGYTSRHPYRHPRVTNQRFRAVSM
jgi:hypothetical protein